MQNRNLAKEIFTRKHDIASSSSIVENIFKVFSSFSTGKEVTIMTATFPSEIGIPLNFVAGIIEYGVLVINISSEVAKS